MWNRKQTERKRYQRQYHRDVVKLLKKRLGDKCAHCGNTDHRVLQIDHKNGDGAKERRKTGRGYSYYKYLTNLSDEELLANYQLLCANCNWIKRYEEKEQPFQG